MGDQPLLLHVLARVVDFEFVNVGRTPFFAEETGWLAALRARPDIQDRGAAAPLRSFRSAG